SSRPGSPPWLPAPWRTPPLDPHHHDRRLNRAAPRSRSPLMTRSRVPPHDDTIDGDVYVTPRYLAGTTTIGDPGLEPLRALGWELHHDDLANAYLTAPDRKV